MVTSNPATTALAPASSSGAAPRAPIRVPKTAEIVADAIRRMITTGELRDGDTLSSEARVIADFAVSRPTVREAFRILESEKLISVSRGARGGARVHEPKPEEVARYAGFVLQSRNATYADVYRERSILEPPIARSVAEDRGASAGAVLRAAVAAERAAKDSRRFGSAVAAFHRSLVELSDNPALILVSTMLESIVGRYQEQISQARPGSDEARHTSQQGLRSQEKLIDLIEAGDGMSAEAHWRKHMDAAARVWLNAGAGAAIVDWGG